jgi:ATP-dependent RNA helicase SUPV3L1/SUV3
MREPLTRRGQCAFCVFRASQQRLTVQRQHGVRHRSAAAYKRKKEASKDSGEYGIGKATLPYGPAMVEELKKISSPAEQESVNYRPMRVEEPRKTHRPGDDRPAINISRPHIPNRFTSPGDRIPKYISPLATERKESAYDAFGGLLEQQCDTLRSRLSSGDMDQARAWGIRNRDQLGDEMSKFKSIVRDAVDKAGRSRLTSKDENPLFFHLRKAFITSQSVGLHEELQFRFMAFVVQAQFPVEKTSELQAKIADMRHPIEWYPATRALQRTVHLHVGPTNSGKTYQALQRLEAAKSGIYAGPLRLLAHEVYTRFNAKGKKCALITGEERRIPEGLDSVMNSCTVEMVPLNTFVDCAVIDEIQMLGDPGRGWAWTQAFLGVMAKEVHLCGELRTEPLIRDLCAAMGDKLIIHRYERLGGLEAQRTSLKGNLRRLEKGDAVILFSRVQIHAMKSEIEKIKGKRCAVVYGSLPPETRAQQAALFNDPDNDYDYLVASNAVGMGLNLSIKRVVFESTSKHDGRIHARLEIPEINQIAGRAGRYKSAHDAIKSGVSKATVRSKPNIGLVTTLENGDLPIVQKALATKVGPLMSAGIFPPNDVIIRFAGLFPPKTPFSYILLRLQELAVPGSQFHLCRLRDAVEIADLIQPYDLSVIERLAFTAAPVNLRDPGFQQVVAELAQCVSNQTGGELLDLKSIPLELLEQDIHDYEDGVKIYLRRAETLHKSLTLYLWLSYRFAGVFRSQALAFHVKAMVEEKIDQCLADIRFDLNERRKKDRAIIQRLERKEAEARQLFDDVESDEGAEAFNGGTRAVKRGYDLSEDTPVSETNISIPVEWEDSKPEATSSTT